MSLSAASAGRHFGRPGRANLAASSCVACRARPAALEAASPISIDAVNAAVIRIAIASTTAHERTTKATPPSRRAPVRAVAAPSNVWRCARPHDGAQAAIDA